ncbi:tetratricopeptide repeat protein [Aquiflexum gelatinilyticum]|uniref:Tetratricopeptide repeat protein n=1 Tax=Aquiflexum gelatinilyticum TaxID=2961943 RepID=A0A9X2P658_9BACT|nr:tetratricopeptide repeat protein [Aquiflexum gelatinilyticum]MCR9015028.1 tetratricopeptide repeat protein [Aquiflexum gelatinilyticum]
MKKLSYSFLFLLVIFFHGGKSFSQNIIKLDSLQLALKHAGSDTAKFNTLMQLSNLYNGTDYLKALEFAREAKEFAIEKKLKKKELLAETTIGNVAISQGNYKIAATHYFNVLKAYEEIQDTSGIISLNNNLGAAYDRMGEFDKALASFFKAQEYLNASNNGENKKLVLPSIYNNIGNIYQTKGDPNSALTYYEKALDLALQVPKLKAQGIAYNNIGKLYFNELNQPEKALEYLTKGLAFREEIGDLGEVARSLVILSNFHFQQKEFAKGKQYAQRALEIGEKIGSLDIQSSAFGRLSEIAEANGDFQAALVAFRKSKEFNDSIINQQASREITRLQLQYDFEKEEKIRSEEASQTRFKYLLTITALSVGLILAVLITFIIRSKARQTEMKQKNLALDVEIKNKELTTNVMYLIRKNELINNVAERLLKLQRRVLPENQKVFQEIILDLQREADNDSWKEFELRFNQVHSEFYTTLRKLYPDLSPADEKLCAFLRLNMSSKEIAAVSQQSIKSVEVARARLRKKLNLTNTNSNLVSHLANL